MAKTSNHDQVIKIQKLRRAVARLRNFRETVPQEAPKQSWFARLKEHLGINTTR